MFRTGVQHISTVLGLYSTNTAYKKYAKGKTRMAGGGLLFYFYRVGVVMCSGTVEGGSVNRCFQVGKFSRKVGYGKLGRGRQPISTARGNI
jgi:hypothetical protein